MANRIGLFGGSFDPPHNGHIHVIVSLKETYHLDQVYIVPASTNPLKPVLGAPEHRLAMSHLAFDSLPFCKIVDVEMQRGGPSYTIETLQWLLEHDEAFARAERFLLLGADGAASFSQWKEVDRILAIVTPIVAARSDVGVSDLPGAIQKGWTTTKLLDISSTMIRSYVQRGMSIDHLVPPAVANYIRTKKLYS